MLALIAPFILTLTFKGSLQSCSSTAAITTCTWDSLKSAKPLQVANYKSYLSFSRGNLERVPSRAFTSLSQITTLQLIGNKIRTFEDDSFAGLVNLKQLSLYDNKLKTINRDALRGCENLENLDLGMNQISSVHENAFQHFAGLKQLNLAFNSLTSVPQAVNLLPKLRVLRLDNNAIEVLKSHAFSRLNNLEELFVSDNKLKKIERDSFKGLSQLNKLDLRANFLTAIDVADIAGDAGNLISVSLSLNEFQCRDLTRILEDLKLKNVKVPRGVSKSPNNVMGIACKNE